MLAAALAAPTIAEAHTSWMGNVPLTDIVTTVLAQPTAPVQIKDCYAGINGVVRVGVEFSNVDHRTAKTIRFGFEELDAFGQPLELTTDPPAQVIYLDLSGAFSTDTVIGGIRSKPMGFSYVNPNVGWIKAVANVASVRCSVKEVLFADGSVWNADGT